MYEPSAELAICVKYLLAADGDMMVARDLAERHRAPDRVRRILEKSAIGAGHLGDTSFGEVLGDWRIAEGGFWSSLRTRSVFARLLDSGARRVPLRTRVAAVTASATAWARGEGKARPVSRLTLAGATLVPITATALTVFTDETARDMSAAGQSLVASELRGAVADELDREFFGAIIDSGTPSFLSAGNDLEGMRNDVFALLSAVNVGGADLIWCMSAGAANGATLLDPRQGMTPTGGEFYGSPAMVSGALPVGRVYLIDANSIAANADAISIETSRQAAVEMEDSSPVGDATAGAGTSLLSLWQSGSIGVKAEITFAAEKVRGSAIAELADVNWAMPSS